MPIMSIIIVMPMEKNAAAGMSTMNTIIAMPMEKNAAAGMSMTNLIIIIPTTDIIMSIMRWSITRRMTCRRV